MIPTTKGRIGPLFFVFLFSGATRAIDHNICVETRLDSTDIDAGEDRFRYYDGSMNSNAPYNPNDTFGPSRQSRARGMRARVRARPASGGTWVTTFDGYLSDGSNAYNVGCTGPMSVPAACPSNTCRWEVQISANGIIYGEELRVIDAQAAAGEISAVEGITTWTRKNVMTATGAEQVFDFGSVSGLLPEQPKLRAINTYQIVAYGLYRRSGGVPAPTRDGDTRHWRVLSVYNDDSIGAQFNNGSTVVGLNDHTDKWKVLHEFGHQIGSQINPSLSSTGCTTFQSHSRCSDFGSGHRITSLEDQRCALGEGFATFWATIVMNDHDDPTDACFFRYWKGLDGQGTGPKIDCLAGIDNIPDETYFQQDRFGQCTASTPATCTGHPENGTSPLCVNGLTICADGQCDLGLANEGDWIRTLWNFYAAGPTNQQVSFDNIVHILSTSTPWGAGTAFACINERILSGPYSQLVRDRWEQYTTENGVRSSFPSACPTP